VGSQSHTFNSAADHLWGSSYHEFGKKGMVSMRPSEFIDKDVFALDEKIGKVKGMEVDPEEWKVTHLEIELTKDVAESVLGAKKGGVRNMINILAIEKGTAAWTDKGLQVRVSKDQLHMYLRPVVKK
jgi:sporulation protein YlmC with PRC-barrel domain